MLLSMRRHAIVSMSLEFDDSGGQGCQSVCDWHSIGEGHEELQD